MNFFQTIRNIHKQSQFTWLEFLLLCLFFMSFSLGQLSRVELGQVTFYAHDLIIGLWLMLRCPRIIDSFKKALLSKALEQNKAWLIWLGWVALGLSVAYLQTLNLVPLLYISRIILYLLFVVSLFSRRYFTRLIVRSLLISSGIYMVWFGLLQYVLIPDSRYLLLFGWDEHYYRLIGPLLDPNFSGILYVLMGWGIISLKNKMQSQLWLTLLLLVGTAVILTYSRATYLSLVSSAVFVLLLHKEKLFSLKKGLIFALIVLAGLAIYFIAPKPGGDGVNLLRVTSIQARMNSTTGYFNSLEPHHWIIGTGLYSPLPENTNVLSHSQQPDNLVVLLIVQTGVVGVVLLLSALTKYIAKFRNLEPATQAALVAVLVHTQFNNSLLEPFIFLSLGILLITQNSEGKIKEST